MGENRGLEGRPERGVDAVDQVEQAADMLDAVSRRIDPDHRVAAPVHQPVDRARGDALRIVLRMVGLGPGRALAGQTDSAAVRGGDLDRRKEAGETTRWAVLS